MEGMAIGGGLLRASILLYNVAVPNIFNSF